MTPNGVICGGAVDGSNQVGAMVTWKAITAWPAGCCAAAGTATAKTSVTAISGRTKPGRRVGPVARGISALRAPRTRSCGAGPRGRASYHLPEALGLARAEHEGVQWRTDPPTTE